jgi:hypothetical protein
MFCRGGYDAHCPATVCYVHRDDAPSRERVGVFAYRGFRDKQPPPPEYLSVNAPRQLATYGGRVWSRFEGVHSFGVIRSAGCGDRDGGSRSRRDGAFFDRCSGRGAGRPFPACAARRRAMGYDCFAVGRQSAGRIGSRGDNAEVWMQDHSRSEWATFTKRGRGLPEMCAFRGMVLGPVVRKFTGSGHLRIAWRRH